MSLGAKLRALNQSIDFQQKIQLDPLGVVKGCPYKQQEVAALVVACLSYGRAKSIRGTTRKLLEAMGGFHPRDWTLSTTRDKRLEALMEIDFKYRFTGPETLNTLLEGIRHGIEQHGSLEGLYESNKGESHKELASLFVRDLRSRAEGDSPGRWLKHLISDPSDGSACKRLHMFFRWVVRQGEPDLGLWTSVDPSELIIPLDTHVARISRYTGLLNRQSTDHKAAEEATESLACLDPPDPTRYDFALAHLGISGQCQHEYVKEVCEGCPLFGVCELAKTP